MLIVIGWLTEPVHAADWATVKMQPFSSSRTTVVGQFLATFKDYPPIQRPSSFSSDQIVEKSN